MPTLNSGGKDGSTIKAQAIGSLEPLKRRSITEELAALVGTSPETKIKIQDVDVNFTVDLGSQVTIINEEFFNNHL